MSPRNGVRSNKKSDATGSAHLWYQKFHIFYLTGAPGNTTWQSYQSKNVTFQNQRMLTYITDVTRAEGNIITFELAVSPGFPVPNLIQETGVFFTIKSFKVKEPRVK